VKVDDDGVVAGRASDSELWRVCIRDMAGQSLGAGIALGEGFVLTCAHVVELAGDPVSAPGMEVLVDFVSLRGSSSVRATVVADCWHPAREDESADIALLRLAPGSPEVGGARLRRLPEPAHRSVQVFGFPGGPEYGVWAYCELAGASGPAGEWVQVDSQLPGQRVRRGFSGSGVIDDFSGAVVGMIVTEFSDETERLAWMISVDTIVRYIPRVARWVGADLGSLPPPGIVITIGGPIAKGLDPLQGAIKTIVNLAGCTPDEARRSIEARRSTAFSASRSTDARSAPTMTVALAGIDESSQPQEILHKVVKPLVDEGTEVEIHFGGENSPGVADTREWRQQEIRFRTKNLAQSVESVEAEESKLRELAAKLARHVDPVPEVPWFSIDLHLRARALAAAPPDADQAKVRRTLASTERKTERALSALARLREELKSRRERHEELKGLLAGYNARAWDHKLMEDKELSVLYRAAAQELANVPCSLPMVEELVETYVRAVRRRLNGEPEANE
jgi:hypothetical protein